jgi:hypothetical protein
MGSRRTNDERRLAQLIADLEARVRQLERRVKAPKVVTVAAVAAPRRRGKPRSRCAGCLQELPVGRRGDACAYCGFRFDAVPPIPPRRTGSGRL